MNGYNQCSFVGNLGRDPEQRMAGRATVAAFSIAVTEQWDRDGQKQERTEWVNIEAWGKAGDACMRYLKKGSRIFVTGPMRTKRWKGQDGADKSRVVISVSGYNSKILFLTKAGVADSDGGSANGYAQHDDSRVMDDTEDPPF